MSLLQTVIHFNGEMIPDTCSPSSPHPSCKAPPCTSEGAAGHRAHCPHQSGGQMSQASHWGLHTDELLSLLQDFTLGCCSPGTVYGHAPPLPSFPCPPSNHHVEPGSSRKIWVNRRALREWWGKAAKPGWPCCYQSPWPPSSLEASSTLGLCVTRPTNSLWLSYFECSFCCLWPKGPWVIHAQISFWARMKTHDNQLLMGLKRDLGDLCFSELFRHPLFKAALTWDVLQHPEEHKYGIAYVDLNNVGLDQQHMTAPLSQAIISERTVVSPLLYLHSIQRTATWGTHLEWTVFMQTSLLCLWTSES